MTFLLETIRLGLSNLRLHLLRSFLTALGIILGIAAVILMMSIAKGAAEREVHQLELLGARNVILRSIRPPEQESMVNSQSNQRSWVSAYGLTRRDLYRLESTFEGVAREIVPLKLVGSAVTRKAKQMQSQAYGTTPALSRCANFSVMEGGRYLTDTDLEAAATVCVIGYQVARQMFPLEEPIGQTLRIDAKVFRVVGVMNPIGLAGGTGSALVGRDLNRDIHIPLTTAEYAFGDLIIRRSSGQRDNTRVEISEVYLSFATLNEVPTGALVAQRTVDLSERDRIRDDVEVIVPFELIENAKRMAQTWSRVMLAIAAIALIVGGTGIMNIMLASVTERTREIGIRRALGATRHHIITQFLVETGVLSLLGGIVGILVGIGGAVALGSFEATAEIFPTVITTWSIVVSFIVACGVGIIFGMYPANVAARMDPIVALRHD